MGRKLRRRQLIATGCAVAASLGFAGCLDGAMDSGENDTTEPNEVVTTEPEPESVFIPSGDFDMEYDQGASLDEKGSPWDGVDNDGTLTVTHAGGDRFPASELFLRGTLITTAGDGQWYEQADATPDEPDRIVTAGDSLTIEVNADAEASVVWEPHEGNGTGRLKTWTGSDA